MAKFFPHRELTSKFLKICFEINTEYGPHHNERIYHALLVEKLTRDCLPFISKPKISVYSKDSGKEIGFYVPDFVIDNSVIVELKVSRLPLKQDEIQLLEYLKTTPYEVGYIVNFGTLRLYFKRIIYTNDRKNLLSDKQSLSLRDKQSLLLRNKK